MEWIFAVSIAGLAAAAFSGARGLAALAGVGEAAFAGAAGAGTAGLEAAAGWAAGARKSSGVFAWSGARRRVATKESADFARVVTIVRKVVIRRKWMEGINPSGSARNGYWCPERPAPGASSTMSPPTWPDCGEPSKPPEPDGNPHLRRLRPGNHRDAPAGRVASTGA